MTLPSSKLVSHLDCLVDHGGKIVVKLPTYNPECL